MRAPKSAGTATPNKADANETRRLVTRDFDFNSITKGAEPSRRSFGTANRHCPRGSPAASLASAHSKQTSQATTFDFLH